MQTPEQCVRSGQNLTITRPERPHYRRLGVFIVNFYHFSYNVLVFPLLTLFFMKMYLYWQLVRYSIPEENFKGWNPANIYLVKVSNRKTRKICEICSKLTIKIPERRY